MMPRYRVEVQFTETKTRELSIWAKDEEAALDKAEEIVSGWDGVDSAEAINAEADEDA